jgi:predicted PurR-regulated permease PerM
MHAMNRNEEQLRWIVWLILTGLTLFLCWKMLEPFVNILLSAVVQATVFLPLHQYILKKLKNPSLSALATIGIILLIVTAPLIAVTIGTISQATNMAEDIQHHIADLQAKMATGQAQEFFLKIRPWLNLDPSYGSNTIQRLLENSAEFVMKNTMNILGGTLGAIFGGVLVLFTMYYLFRDHEKIIQLLPDFLPMERHQGEALLRRIQEVLNASMNGVLVIALIQGTLGGVMFWILGIPASLLWGVAMVFLSLIPLLGTSIIWFPAALILLSKGYWIKCIILIFWGVAVIGMADNILRPRLVGQKAHMHELLIFFSVMGGVKVFGVLGILLGPVVLSVAIGFIEVARTTKKEGALFQNNSVS